MEYKKFFSFKQFLLGTVTCRHNFLGSDASLSDSKVQIAQHSLNFRLIWIFLKKAFS